MKNYLPVYIRTIERTNQDTIANNCLGDIDCTSGDLREFGQLIEEGRWSTWLVPEDDESLDNASVVYANVLQKNNF